MPEPRPARSNVIDPLPHPPPLHGVLPLHLLAALGGLGWQLQQSRLLALAERQAVLLACLGLLGLAWVLRRRGSSRLAWTGWCATLAAAALAGWLACDLRAQGRLDDRLDPALDGALVQLTGVVRGLPVRIALERHGARCEIQLDERALFYPSDAALASWMAQAHQGQAAIVYERD